MTPANRTLFISDLDSTLLRDDGTLSPRTVSVVNELIESGGLFTYATARSFVSASAVTAGLRLNLPVITYGGSAIIDPRSGGQLSMTFLPEAAVAGIMRVAAGTSDVEPVFFSLVDGQDRVQWREPHETRHVRAFLDARVDDPRLLPAADWSGIDQARVLSVGMGGSPEALRGVRDALGDVLDGCFPVLWEDWRPDGQWLDINPAAATKGTAVRWLRARTGADRVVAFGDNLNDVPLFAEADAGYAVANARPELCEMSAGVIGGNDDDGVAEWLAEFSLPAAVREM